MVRPRYIVDLERAYDIVMAMAKRVFVGKMPPVELAQELLEICVREETRREDFKKKAGLV